MKHFVIVKWNEKVADKDLFYQKAYDAFKDVTKIDGVSDLNVYKSNTDRSNRYDVMIEITCTKEGLANYDISKLHQDWKANYSEYIESKAIFDYE